MLIPSIDLTRDPTCASDTDFNCPAMYKFAKMCDQSKVDKLYYWGYSDFVGLPPPQLGP